jgi:hypothetical protein
MSNKTTIIYPDDRPPRPPEPAEDSHRYVIAGTHWTRYTPPPSLRLRSEFDNDAEAGKGVALAGKTFFAGRTAEGKSYEDLFRLDFQVKDGSVEVLLTPKRGIEITEHAYEAVRGIEAAWIDAFQKGVLGMKPERTQFVFLAPSEVSGTRKLSGSEWEQVTYHHTVSGEYQFPSTADAAAACEIVLKVCAGKSAVPMVTVRGKTLSVELRSSRGHLLTEVEFGLVYEIETALSGPGSTME